MIFITGDTHGEFTRLSKKRASYIEENDTLIICGDFGNVWNNNNEEQYWRNWLKDKKYTICFCDGNHENFDLLNKYEVVDFCDGKAHKIADNIYHLMRGEIFTIEDKTFFVFGGAKSHDISGGVYEVDDILGIKRAQKNHKSFRVNHISWWAQELPSDEEMQNGINNLNKHNFNVDYVISHCAPASILSIKYPSMAAEKDYLMEYFDSLIAQGLEFKHWWCGHYHCDEKLNSKVTILYDGIIGV